MKYFNNCKTLEELRKEYKRLVKQNHPDNGGSEDAIKVINVEYETALNNLKNADENENAWKYDQEKDELFRDALNKIINLEDVKIEIIGCWIWVTGNTYNVKELLKAAGFKYCGKKKAWSWHAGERYYKKSKRALSMDELRNLYGSEEIEKRHADRIA
jgi:curved DNA-binding protein CbpA